MRLEEMSPDELRRLMDSPLAGDALKDRIQRMLALRENSALSNNRIFIRPTEPEAAEQQAGINLLLSRGWKKWRVGQRDARGTQDPGFPDVTAIHPKHGLLFWEAKGKGGRQSEEQKDFQRACEEAGLRYVLGGCETMRAALNELDE
jgi:hypothetical protein